jgi:hypothetical protein
MPTTERLPIVIVACQVLESMLTPLLSGEAADGISEITILDYGLHSAPAKMPGTLQEILDGIEQPTLVVLGYGLCGNGLNGVKTGKHTLLIPRTDDCIAMLLGSYQAYRQEFATVPGTYYLSKGWLESGSHPLQEYEEYLPKYGPDRAIWLMDMQYKNYERLMLVTHSEADLEQYRPVAQKVAHFCERWGMRYEERTGSDSYVRLLLDAARSLSQGLELPPEASHDLLLLQPNCEIRQELFIR